MRIKLSLADLQKGELHTEGWYKGIISGAISKPSKDKQSQNYEYWIEYETGSKQPGMETREIKSQFNSQAVGFMKPFLAALEGKSVKEYVDAVAQSKDKEVDFEWEQVKGGKLQFRIENKPREDNGLLTSKITDFAPYDYKTPFSKE